MSVSEDTNTTKTPEIPAEGLPVQPGSSAWKIWVKCLDEKVCLSAETVKNLTESCKGDPHA